MLSEKKSEFFSDWWDLARWDLNSKWKIDFGVVIPQLPRLLLEETKLKSEPGGWASTDGPHKYHGRVSKNISA